MKLKIYLETNGISASSFAKSINVSRQTVSRYVNGYRVPSVSVMKKITDVTDQQVTANDFYQ